MTWFRYGDIPDAFRKEIARQLDKPFNEADADRVNTYDIIYPVYGPAVGLLSNYGSDEKGREDYYPLENKYLVMEQFPSPCSVKCRLQFGVRGRSLTRFY